MQPSASRLIEEKEHNHKIAKLWVWIVWLSTMVRYSPHSMYVPGYTSEHFSQLVSLLLHCSGCDEPAVHGRAPRLVAAWASIVWRIVRLGIVTRRKESK